MDKVIYFYLAAVPGVIALFFWSMWADAAKQCREYSGVMSRRETLTGLSQGVISSYEKKMVYEGRMSVVYDVPVVSYTVGDNIYSMAVQPAAKPRGKSPYNIGDKCTVRYDVYEPVVCFVDEFEGEYMHMWHSHYEIVKPTRIITVFFLALSLFCVFKGIFG